jgi:hypothetical protein
MTGLRASPASRQRARGCASLSTSVALAGLMMVAGCGSNTEQRAATGGLGGAAAGAVVGGPVGAVVGGAVGAGVGTAQDEGVDRKIDRQIY